MIIRKVSLKNIKSYREAEIELPEGITGIAGLNGAGKSTVLESIGYALFDCLPYTQGEFVRKGEKTGEVAVEILGADGIGYRVVRKCGASQAYYIENEDGARVCEGKDDVGHLLCEILGYRVHELGQLRALFENAIGVLQGTFVSEFLESAARRKAIFDPLLRIDEYKDAFTNLGVLVNHVEGRIRSYDDDVLVRKTRIERLPGLHRERSEKETRRTEIALELPGLENEKEAIKRAIEELDRAGVEIKGLEQALSSERAMVQQRLRNLESARAGVAQSEQATGVLKKHESDYRQYRAKITERDEKEKNREKLYPLLEQNAQLNARLEGIKIQLKHCSDRQTEIGQFKAQIKQLEPLVAEQDHEEETLRQLLTEKKAKEGELSQIREKMARVSNSKGNICPILLNIECEAVVDFSEYFRDQVSRVEGEITSLSEREKAVRTTIDQLHNPRSILQAKREQINKEGQIETDLQKGIREKAVLLADQEKLLPGLAELAKVGEQLKVIGSAISACKSGHDDYQKNIALAELLDERKLAAERAAADQREAEKQYAITSARLENVRATYDPVRHQSLKKAFEQVKDRIVSLSTELKMSDERLKAIAAEIAEIQRAEQEIEEIRQKQSIEKDYLNFIGIARNIIKVAGPEIVKVYIDLISREATDTYGEIAGDRRIAIRWTPDYDIVMSEDGRERAFRQLSGGEQMSAALAVRLAILKILTSSDVVFLDEPTQNMDEGRRQNLAQEIMRITGFRQMIVISHDDTFNANLENVIEIEKVNGESCVRGRTFAGP